MHRIYFMISFFCFNGILCFTNLPYCQIQKNWTREELIQKIPTQNLEKFEFVITSQYSDSPIGIHHVYIQQYLKQIPLIPVTIGFHFDSSDQLIYSTGNFVSIPSDQIANVQHRIDQAKAIKEVIKSKYPQVSVLDVTVSRNKKMPSDFDAFHCSYIKDDEIKIRPCFYLNSEKIVLPGYHVLWKRKFENEWLEIIQNAIDGQILEEYNQILSCDFQHMKFYRENLFQFSTTTLNSPPIGAYRVFQMPIESPLHGGRDLIYQPWTKAQNASPFTWHGDGIYLYYSTRGNNADVYEDSDGDDLPTGGDAARAFGGSQLNFDFALNPNLPPLQNKNASITNLFYWCNLMHDVWYQYGFHEIAGNFQINNANKGGAGNDYVIAEGIDFINGARNNANFGTPPDGYPGVMQLYVWQPPVNDELIIESPASVSGKYKFIHTPISPQIFAPINRNIVLVNDGSTYPSFACTNLINAAELNGKIAMVDKGICSFTGKMSRIQSAGAVAVIICNSDHNEPSGIGGWMSGITIPAVMISKKDCQKIKLELTKGVNATILPTSSISFKVNQKSYIFSRASFGPAISNSFASIVQAVDNVNLYTDGCETLVNGNQLFGKIAMIDEGNCELSYKAIQAQNFGAVAVVICKQSAGYPDSIPKGTYGQNLQIPLIELSKMDCQEIKLLGSPNGQFSNLSPQLTDGNFDAGIICHEYGHGISNRLTGGPANVSCLNNAEQMGEGWSDYFGLVMTMRTGDLAYQNRGMGVYSSGHAMDGVGVRPYPYNVSLSMNPANYSQLSDMVKISQPHGIGYIWCSMLWDMTWALISHYGYEPDIYNVNSTKGNIIAYKLVMDGLKLQACSPGFVDGRNAILKADSLLFGGKHSCLIWNVFARRGLGFSANQGSSFRRDDGIASSDLPNTCSFMTESELFSSVFLADYELVLLAQSKEKGIELNWKIDQAFQTKKWVLSRRTNRPDSDIVIFNSQGSQNELNSFLDREVIENEDYFYQLRIFEENKMLEKTEWVFAKLKSTPDISNCYPNPVTEILSIIPAVKQNQRVQLYLYNSKLQMIEQVTNDYKVGTSIQLNCISLIPGAYFIQIKTETGIQCLKFIKY
ncbi:MAG: M36 family metallopeptidase [Saprospiraceae bacterium]|nr:M36 family metallopeptidase [Saprospiraceae bacterium]